MELNVRHDNTMRDYLRIIFRQKTAFVLIIIILTTSIFIQGELKTPTYSATVRLYVMAEKKEDELYRKLYHARSILAVHADNVTSREVLERVVNALKLYERPVDDELTYASGLKAILMKRNIAKLKRQLEKMNSRERKEFLFENAVERLRSSISTSLSDEYTMFTITVSDVNPAVPAVIANSVSRSYLIYDLQQQIAEIELKYGEKHASVIQVQNFLDTLYDKLDGRVLTDKETISGPATIKVLDQAQSAALEGERSKGLNIFVSILASVFMALMLAVIFDYLDQTFKSPRDIEKYLNIPVLCSIPRTKSKNKVLIKDHNPEKTNYSTSFQCLSEQVQLLMKEHSVKSLIVTDVEASKDSATIIVNLGNLLTSNGGHKVLIIDANFRTPSVGTVLNISDSPGLIEVLEEKIQCEAAINDLGDGLHVIPTSRPLGNPISFLNSHIMTKLAEEVKKNYDLVLFACSDIKNFPDTAILSSLTDGTVLVINEGKTHRQVTKYAIAPLEQKKIKIRGAIMNNRTYSIPKLLYKLT